ncbi:peptidase S8/S53 subtilisin kexin sedolisin [Natrinema pellirubrum DSM 15624]|uniref:Peptidase S8/S53 subtilisin kexin sedolisin n=1 Tax=Natrinema pellirubrum (strain DSM 15624 / CIP 106293 / JCM 10476 / NCIMB 786 / 157) TaxID=797303 RepID=L0JKI5_NATP1|nr:S8 family serine peptidase [Natrinema pellirubrum]AGB31097.1 subtilisin-like serine protease [Natrinema pellirubrum DSM 15624]ELY81061.1 peptidase S8/S53 subtilisin kexin sedolisin [Natrinema pellirubrum DSM 15624]
MKLTAKWVFCILIATAFVATSITIGVLFVSGSVAAETPNATTNETIVHPEVADTGTGETQEVLVHFESDTNTTTVQSAAEPASLLKQNAAAAQNPFLEQARRTAGITVKRTFWITNSALVTVDTTETSVEAVAAMEGVTKITPNFQVQTLDSATKPNAGPTRTAVETPVAADSPSGQTNEPASTPTATYGLEQIDAPNVWTDFDTRGDGVRVAVLDTGVDTSHPDIDLAEENGWADFDLSGNRRFTEPNDYDPDGHGTHVTGTIAGGNASGHSIGVAPDAKIMHGAVATENCETGCQVKFAQMLAGLEWAIQNDADVLSMSLGGSGYRQEFIEPIRTAQSEGIVVVAASGNQGPGTSTSPGNSYDAIAVGATDRYESVTSFSSGETIDTERAWGEDAPDDWPDEYVVPDVVAPGASVTSAEPGGEYGQMSGTSMATPHVAGVVALLQSSTDDRLSPAEINNALTETSRTPSGTSEQQDTRYGHGIVDAHSVVVSVREPLNIETNVKEVEVKTTETNITIFVTGSDGNAPSGQDGATNLVNATVAISGPNVDNETTIDSGAATFSVRPDQKGTITAEVTAYNRSNGTHHKVGPKTVEVTVNDDNTSADDYMIDGKYTNQSIFAAMADWRNDDLDTTVVFNIIERWRTGS